MSFEDSYIGKLRKVMGKDFRLICDGAVVFIENEFGKILMHTKFKDAPWAFPGGIGENNESLEECAIRELKEEFNLDVENMKMFAFRDATMFTIDNGDKLHVKTLAFYTKDFSGDLKIQEDEIIQFDWIDIEKNNLNVFPRERVLLKAFLEWKRTGEFQYISYDENKTIERKKK